MEAQRESSMRPEQESRQESIYYTWIRLEAAKVHSDGCTGVSEWHQECCFEHDLGCLYSRDPKEAFRLFQAGNLEPWVFAEEISRSEVDKRFALCNFTLSSGGWGYTRALVRYWGSRIGSFLGIGVRK